MTEEYDFLWIIENDLLLLCVAIVIIYCLIRFPMSVFEILIVTASHYFSEIRYLLPEIVTTDYCFFLDF